MSSQHGMVGPRKNLTETWSSELTLTVLGTWHSLVVPHSDLAVGMERGLPSGLVGLTLGFSPLLSPRMTSEFPTGK